MQKKILITGVSGFVGKHLARELKGRGYQVVGVGQDTKPSQEIASLLSDYHECDLTNKTTVSQLPIEDIDTVISLAGLASVGASFDAPEEYKKVNVKVFSLLAEEVISRNKKVRVIAVSTGAVYDANQPMPLTENSKLIATGSPYGISKVMMEEAAHNLRRKGLNCVIVRPFNHIGPGQKGGFLLADLYQKLQHSRKTGEPMKTGNLKTRRDYTDVRDVVRAYADLAAASTLRHQVYNICNGRSLAGEKILDLLLKTMGLDGKIKVVKDPTLLRPDDPKEIYGSFVLLHSELGWKPQIPIEQTVADFVSAVTS